MGKIYTCCALFICSAALAFGFAQQPATSGAVTEADALDRLLTDFATATATLDVAGAESLFLPPDDTADGRNRQANLSELRKDWQRARESGASVGPAVQFRNVQKIVRADMLINGPGGPKEGTVSEVEFTAAFTKDGWKIVSMTAGPTR
jgi:hypothetical protein